MSRRQGRARAISVRLRVGCPWRSAPTSLSRKPPSSTIERVARTPLIATRNRSKPSPSSPSSRCPTATSSIAAGVTKIAVTSPIAGHRARSSRNAAFATADALGVPAIPIGSNGVVTASMVARRGRSAHGHLSMYAGVEHRRQAGDRCRGTTDSAEGAGGPAQETSARRGRCHRELPGRLTRGRMVADHRG
jgi:hypothetical protein